MIQDVQKTYKQKTCKNNNCKMKFTPEREFQVACSYECSIHYAKQLISKREATKKENAGKELREYKKTHKPTLLQLAQKLVNQYVRLRDKGERCISCGHNFANGRQEHAGHYIARSKSSLLRFDERNINTQCSICNDHLSGNVAEYKVGLINKIGIKEVEYLESNKTALKTWTVEELKELITKYRAKIKQYKTMEINNAN